MKLKTVLSALSASALVLGCAKPAPVQEFFTSGATSKLYSKIGREHKVSFQALFQSTARRMEDLGPQSLQREIRRTTQFLFGPLTHRALGGIQKGDKITPDPSKAFLKDGVLMVPYQYDGTWILNQDTLPGAEFNIPVPFSVEGLKTSNWKSCTDQGDAEHSTWSFFWYFWDPSRPGCEHQAGVHYQEVSVQLGGETVQTSFSFPEYKRMIRMENGVPNLAMTFAFGYVYEASKPNPFRDWDPGMQEFQAFYLQTKSQLQALGFTETPVTQADYTGGMTRIGSQFQGLRNGVQVRITIVAAAGVDQMEIFSTSFARKHEGFFGWFGHSRVGSGFDADTLRYKLMSEPEIYSITPDYQLIYWAGCNSYSYYTVPFFEMKSQLDPLKDPHGTRNLDLISNALPSLFAFNAANAQFALQALLHWETPTSYQDLIRRIEFNGQSWGTDVIVNVLGDEDNQP